MFIVLEGIDGCGKSTQIKLLADRLHNEGVDVVVTREPFDGCAVGKALRDYYYGRDQRVYSNRALAYWHAAARADHVERIIWPSLNSGKTVLSDRYVMSSVVYQSSLGSEYLTGSESVAEEVRMLNARFPAPDRYIILDIDPEEAARRVASRGVDVPEEIERLKQLREEYVSYKEAAALIDANRSVAQVHEDIYNVCMSIGS